MRTGLYLLMIFFSLGLICQETPPILKFSPNDYDAENQNWAIGQDKDKFIYIANNEGLLEYNGAEWTLYPSPNRTIIRSIEVVGRRIYTGSYMQFGYWEREPTGKLRYHPLSENLEVDLIEDENFWNIKQFENWILFQSYDRIYIYDIKTQQIQYLTDKRNYYRIFKLNDGIYLHKRNGDIYKIEKGVEKLYLKIPKDLDIEFVLNIFSGPDGLLFVTRSQGLFISRGDKISKWNAPSNDELSKLKIFNGIQLKDNGIILGTISEGLFILDQEGSITNRIDQTNGLSNNTVLKLFEDVDGNVWAALDNGVDCLNMRSYIKEFNDYDGTLGTVYCSIVHESNLYIGTNQGLFYRPMESTSPYQLVEGSKGQVWALTIIDGDLLCGHTSGTFLVEKNRVLQIAKNPAWMFRKIPDRLQMLLQGTYSGLNVLVKVNGKWKFKNEIQGFENSARFFEIFEDGEIWVKHGYKGVYKLKANKDFTAFDSTELLSNIPKSRGSGLLKIKNNLLYAYNKGIFKVDREKQILHKDTVLSKLLPNQEYISGKLLTDEKERLWVFTRNRIRYLEKGHLTGKELIKDIPIRNYRRKSIVSFENISHIDHDQYVVGKTNGYVFIDLTKLKAIDHSVFLNGVTLKTNGKNDSLVSVAETGTFKFDQNSLEFKFNVPAFSKYEHIDFQHKLEGHDDSWSQWGPTTSVSYNQLSYGEYTFYLKSKIGDKVSDNIASYQFHIDKPFYLSHLAILGYLSTLLLIVFVTHRSYRRYYRKQHKKVLFQTQRQMELDRIKNEQELTQLKNEKLNQEIENKNRELAISTMSIIKRNEILRGLKKELLSSTYEIKKNDPVLALIDRSLNSSKDWDLFKTAFNNTDKDFLKRMKKKHHTLTPNDLKFCAYLRLNLTSKEIAPLLNISLKSLEIRRYRLRKKMELRSEINLTDYILDL